jgi:hypothetical protein
LVEGARDGKSVAELMSDGGASRIRAALDLVSDVAPIAHANALGQNDEPAFGRGITRPREAIIASIRACASGAVNVARR